MAEGDINIKAKGTYRSSTYLKVCLQIQAVKMALPIVPMILQKSRKSRYTNDCKKASPKRQQLKKALVKR